MLGKKHEYCFFLKVVINKSIYANLSWNFLKGRWTLEEGVVRSIGSTS